MYSPFIIAKQASYNLSGIVFVWINLDRKIRQGCWSSDPENFIYIRKPIGTFKKYM